MARISMAFVVFISFISTVLTIANAFFLKKQFYPSVVYITKSSTSMAIIYMQGAVISYLVFSFLRWIFFGQLRTTEIEHAQERVWHAIMETCLAFTVFRDDFSSKFVIQFVVLFFVKTFHWLTEDRVEYMERSPVITLLFHARLMGILSLLTAVDSYFISHAFFTTLMRGATTQIVFGFEYAILLTIVAGIAINYILHMHDLRSPHPWENKAVYMLYAELFTSFLRCLLYLAFSVVMIKIHTFPLFAIRPFYLTVRALRKAINDVILSRRAINAMNTLFPLATAQELIENDNTCIICREEMTVESGAKKLPCNHIFHPNCLRSWFQRQQTCPTCRTDVLAFRQHTTNNGGLNAVPNGAQRAFQGVQPNFFPFNVQGQVPHPPAGIMPHPFMHFPMPFPQPAQPQQIPQTAQDHGLLPGYPRANGLPQQQQAPSTSQQTPPRQQPTPHFPPFMPPNFFSPFGFPPFPSPFPPFPRPPSFSGLSEAEIAEMEGTERRNVEARIEALRNIASLLDAAMLQLQQYLSVVNLPSTAAFAASAPTPQFQQRQDPTANYEASTSSRAAVSTPAAMASPSPHQQPQPTFEPGTSDQAPSGRPAAEEHANNMVHN